jgi:tRNA-dihydrouridine synthase C
MSPELEQQGRTGAGVPVNIQLLGADPELMALNAQQAVQLGAPAIDINFGCPSKIVNRKMGGSVLLREPERVHRIVTAVRRAVVASIPVTAKMRLGFEDDSLALDNALAIESAGASAVTVHARTRSDGYKTAARWEALAPLREALHIPLIANGDIRSLEDYHRCVELSGCVDVMLGRGAICDPSLARQIKQDHLAETVTPMDWRDITSLILATSEHMARDNPHKHVVMRIKQWLGMLRMQHNEGQQLFDMVRRMQDLKEVRQVLRKRVG